MCLGMPIVPLEDVDRTVAGKKYPTSEIYDLGNASAGEAPKERHPENIRQFLKGME